MSEQERQPKEYLFLRNRFTGKISPVPVTDVDWDNMEAKKNGHRLFEITERKPIRPQPQLRKMPQMPAEVKTPSAPEVTKGTAHVPNVSEQDAN